MSSDSYYSGQPPIQATVTNITIPSVAASTTVEIAATLNGAALGDVGFVVSLAAPIVGFNFPYVRGTGDDAVVIGVTNFTAGAIDPADTMDLVLVLFKKLKRIVATVP